MSRTSFEPRGLEVQRWCLRRHDRPPIHFSLPESAHASSPHLAALIPWNRLHVNLTSEEPITGMSVSVRVEGSADSGRLSSRSTMSAGPMSATDDAWLPCDDAWLPRAVAYRRARTTGWSRTNTRRNGIAGRRLDEPSPVR
jgi:hypothetical protein